VQFQILSVSYSSNIFDVIPPFLSLRMYYSLEINLLNKDILMDFFSVRRSDLASMLLLRFALLLHKHSTGEGMCRISLFNTIYGRIISEMEYA